MPRRLERITPSPDLDVRLKPHLSRDIDIISHDHRVTHLVLHKVDTDHLYGINLRGRKITYPVNQIREIILHR